MTRRKTPIKADDIAGLLRRLGVSYVRRARWVANREAVDMLRKYTKTLTRRKECA